jgi:hypothetical protein
MEVLTTRDIAEALSMLQLPTLNVAEWEYCDARIYAKLLEVHRNGTIGATSRVPPAAGSSQSSAGPSKPEVHEVHEVPQKVVRWIFFSENGKVALNDGGRRQGTGGGRLISSNMKLQT